MNLRREAPQRGLTLIELLLSVAIGAIVLASLNSLVKLGLAAQTAGRGANELAYQGRHALERIADRARAVAPKALGAAAANTSGNWFAPSGCAGAACVMYCRNAGNQLIETTTADASCSGSTVIAANVSTFSASQPAAMGAVDRPVAVLSLTLSKGDNTVTLATSVRLGGGTQ